MGTSGLIGVAVLVVFIMAKVRVSREHERFAEFVLGRFQRFRRPGLQFKWTGSEVLWVRIRLGDRGEVLAPGIVRVHDADLPSEGDTDLGPGIIVRITGFSADMGQHKVIVTKALDQIREVTCPKCGHRMSMT